MYDHSHITILIGLKVYIHCTVSTFMDLSNCSPWPRVGVDICPFNIFLFDNFKSYRGGDYCNSVLIWVLYKPDVYPIDKIVINETCIGKHKLVA